MERPRRKPRAQPFDPQGDDTHALYTALLCLTDTAECRAFLMDLCTPSELAAMADRWLVARLLHEGLTHRAITEKTGVSGTTVSRVNRCLQGEPGGYRLALNRGGPRSDRT